MWLGLVKTKVDKAMVAVKWHKQLDWRPLQYIINILGVGPSKKEEDLTAWLASGYWLEEEELQNNLRYQSFQLEHFEHLWHLNLQCKYLTYESDLSKLWSKERGASAGPCRAPPLYFKAWFRDTGLYRTCIYMARTHPPSNFANSLNTGDTSGEEGDGSGEGAGDGSHRPDCCFGDQFERLLYSRFQRRHCHLICTPLELVTNIQESPMKGKHLWKIRCWGPFMLEGCANP